MWAGCLQWQAFYTAFVSGRRTSPMFCRDTAVQIDRNDFNRSTKKVPTLPLVVSALTICGTLFFSKWPTFKIIAKCQSWICQLVKQKPELLQILKLLKVFSRESLCRGTAKHIIFAFDQCGAVNVILLAVVWI